MKKILLSLSFIFATGLLFSQDVYFEVDTDNGCAPLTVNFSNYTNDNIDITNMIFHWSFDDGSSSVDGYNASHIFTQQGSYYVYVYADSLGKYIGGFAHEINVDGFSGVFYPSNNSAYCPNENISFYVQDNYNSISWDYGDGSSTENGNYTNHQYTTAGFYDVELTLNHSCGIDVITQVIEISPTASPVPNISANQNEVCIGDEIQFNPGINAESYSWDFKDGINSNNANPLHSFANTGSYWVSVETTNICGNIGRDSILIDVGTNIYVNANFNWEGTVCPNTPINFFSNSSGTHIWNFGNGQSGFSMAEIMSYSSPGTYEVEHIVTNGCGESDTTTRSIQIEYDLSNKPIVNIELLNNNYSNVDSLIICPGSEVQFGNDSDRETNIVYTWYFGNLDTLISSDEEVSYIFNELGNHIVELVAVNGCGGSDTARKTIIVTDTLTPNPNFQTLPSVICPGEYIYFYDDNSSDHNNKYSIWFGDGNSLLNVGAENDSVIPVTARHQYASIGAYEYTFSVTNTCGNTVSSEDTIYVSDTLSSSFYMAFSETESDPDRRACPDELIKFYGVGGASVVWDFGDGVYDTNIIGHHSYPNIGDYTATAIFTSGCGVIDSVEVMAYVGDQKKPYSGFDFSYSGNNPCAGDTVHFIYNGKDESTNISFKWYFGDGDSSMVRNPIHVYDTIANFNVELVVSNGCGDSSSEKSVPVKGIFINDDAISLTDPDCGLTNGSISGITTFGNNLSSVNWFNANMDNVGNTIDIQNLSSGQYAIMVESFTGCSAVSDLYQLNGGEVLAPLAPTLYEYCDGEPMSALTATAQTGGILIWYNDANLTDSLGTGTSFNPELTSTNNYFVTETSGNCGSPATEVNVIFNPVYLITNTIQLCFGDSVMLEGYWQTNSGVFNDTLFSYTGCDSIIQTTLSISTPVTINEYTSICTGDSIFLENAWQTTDGIYTDTLRTENMCDSIYKTTTLSVISAIDYGDRNITICGSDSILLGSVWRHESGIYNDTIQSVLCDSIFSITLTVIPQGGATINETICIGDSIQIGNDWIQTAGIYTDTLSSSYGCDSIIEIILSIITPVIINEYTSICTGDSIFLENAWQTTDGIYTDTLRTENMCDSIYKTTTLSVISAIDYGDRNITICGGDSILLGSVWRHESGIYNDTIQSVLCDSIFSITLTVISQGGATINETICVGDSIQIGNDWVQTAGVYTDTLIASSGCNFILTYIITSENCETNIISIERLNWTVYPNPTTGLFNIAFGKTDNEELKIYNTSGHLIYKTTVLTENLEIDLTNIPSGLYFIYYKKSVQEILVLD